MRIYCDSRILIYFYDHTAPFNLRAVNRLTALAAAGDQIAASDLVRLECRVQPYKNRDAAKLAVFDAFFSRPTLPNLLRRLCSPSVPIEPGHEGTTDDANAGTRPRR